MGKKIFLHIAFDSIFFDYTIKQFETIAKGQSDYLIDIDEQLGQIKFIQNIDKIKKENLSNAEKRDDLLNKLKNYSVIILHCLNENMIDIVIKSDKSIKFIWMLWGAEANSLPKLNKNLFQPITKKLTDRLSKKTFRSKFYRNFPSIHFLLYTVKNHRVHPTEKKILALKRINYCAAAIKEEYDLIQNTYKFNHSWLWYIYYNIEDPSPKQITGNNILVGNSADPRNNHIDALKILAKYNLNNRKIICPLSYGENIPGYTAKVIEEGNKLFGENFIHLTEFMSLKDYNDIIGSCSIIIMNHNCQQALGNIISSLWNGAKLFLNNTNPVYKNFKNKNMYVYSIQENLTSVNNDALNSIPTDKVVHNQKILNNTFSKDVVYQGVNVLINKILS